MRRTTTRKLRNSPGVRIEGRVSGLERTPQSPRVKSGGRVGDPGRTQQSPARAQSSWVGSESPRMSSRSGGGRSPYMERIGSEHPGSLGEKRRLEYRNGGSPRINRVQEPSSPVKPELEIVLKRHAEMLRSRQKSPDRPDGKRAAALVEKMRTPKQMSLIDQQIEVVLRTLNQNVKVEGLYRISGSNGAITGALESFNSGKLCNLDDPHEASGLLKKLLEQGVYEGDKGETLIPAYMQYDLLTLYKKNVEEKNLAEGEKQQFLKELAGWLLKELPAANRRAFLKILAHLKLVAQHHESNKMTAENLAIVFGPRLCAAPTAENPTVLLNYAGVFADLMRMLIEQDFKIEV